MTKKQVYCINCGSRNLEIHTAPAAYAECLDCGAVNSEDAERGPCVVCGADTYNTVAGVHYCEVCGDYE